MVPGREIRDRIVNGKGNSMSRTRSRTFTHPLDGLRKQTITRTYEDGSPPNSVDNTVMHFLSVTEKSESMTDVIAMRPQVRVDPKTLKWRRIRYPSSKYDISGNASRLFGRNRLFRPVQPCTHVKTQIDVKDFNREFYVRTGYDAGSFFYETARTYANPYLFTSDCIAGISNAASLFGGGSDIEYSADAYRQIDWFALTDSFQNSLESFTKAKFLAGEAMYESAIFVDAFKILVNPTRALPILMKNIHKHASPSTMKKYRRMNLGQFARSCKGLTGSAVNAHLSYDFAVKPAIDDVKATLDAHHFVSQRMKYLRQHSGSYVPIRVRSKVDSGFDNTFPTPPNPGQNSKLYQQMAYKYAVGCIGAWARVREDLDWENSWSAYLQYFGVDRLIGLAWELIPFSFVIDWVTDAQEFINTNTRLRTGGPFCGIRSICASLKEESKVNLMFTPGYIQGVGPILNPEGPTRLGSQIKSSYYRYTNIPTTSGLVDFSNLGSFQYTKLAELVFQFFVK